MLEFPLFVTKIHEAAVADNRVKVKVKFKDDEVGGGVME